MIGPANIDQVITDLEAFVASFDFTIPGKDQSLGRDVANTFALGIQARSAEE
jgi:hypothetical protein